MNSAAGRYDVRFDSGRRGIAVRVEAEGYAAVTSPTFLPVEGDKVWDVTLASAGRCAGVVSAPDGKPAAAARVILCSGDQSCHVIVREGVAGDAIPGHSTSAIIRSTQTDDQGRFELIPPARPFILLVLGTSGYAEVTDEELAKNTQLRLGRLGRVEAVIGPGSRPSADHTAELDLQVYPEGYARILHQFVAYPDQQGRAVFENVPAGEGEIVRRCTERQQLLSRMHVSIAPGETTRVALVGRGRPVIGRVVVEPGERPAQLDMTRCRPQLGRWRPRMPSELATQPEEARKKWRDQWAQTEEGKLASDGREYYTVVQADGTFRIDDVPEGRWTLTADAPELRTAADPFVGRPAYYVARLDVSVPPIPGGVSPDSLDIGDVVLTLGGDSTLKPLRTGDVAPPFDVPALGGGRITLAEFRGRYLMLDFWASWCGPCMLEVPNVKKVAERFAGDKRFVLIGMNLDANLGDASQCVKKKELDWPHAMLGEWSKTKVPSAYGVRGIPHAVLIGPDGKVILDDLSGDGMAAVVAQAMKGK